MDDERLQAEAAIVAGYQVEVERLRAACRRGEDMFRQYADVVRQIGFPVVADDFEAYAAEFRAAIDGTPASGQGAVQSGYLANVATVMREEAAEIAGAKGDPGYWLERSAEQMRRYAGWIEAIRDGKTSGIFPLPESGIVAGMDALREAGGKAWDAIEDPKAYLSVGQGAETSRPMPGPATRAVLRWLDSDLRYAEKNFGRRIPDDAGYNVRSDIAVDLVRQFLAEHVATPKLETGPAPGSRKEG